MTAIRITEWRADYGLALTFRMLRRGRVDGGGFDRVQPSQLVLVVLVHFMSML